MSTDVETSLRGPKAYDLARKALQAMEANQVWPTALNFELWVHYVAAQDTPLAAEINGLIEKREPFTEALGEQLATQFLVSGNAAGNHNAFG